VTSNQARRAVQWLLGGTLLAYAFKASFWVEAARDLARTPLADPWFPRVFASAWSLVVTLVLPPLTMCVALLWHRRWAARAAFMVTVCGSAFLLLHQASYNDAAFLTAFWSSLYGVWLVQKIETTEPATFPSWLATRLVCCIVSLMFLGGAIGKLTPGYWDGSILYALNFADSDYWSFRLLRSLLSTTQLRDAATLYSRCVVCIELLLVTLPVWPARVALYSASVALTTMAALNNHLLLSVVGPLLGMCAAALCVTRTAAVPKPALRAIHEHSPSETRVYAENAPS
jgi:hypothetical protein